MIKAEQDRPLLASSRTEYIQVETPSIVTCQHPLGFFKHAKKQVSCTFPFTRWNALKIVLIKHPLSLVQQNKL